MADRMRELEQNIINQAIDAVHARELDAPETRPLLEAIRALVYFCDDCNYARHTCLGCGASVPHAGPGICPECTEAIETGAMG